MLAILGVTFPFFALVLCGYLAARRELLPLAAIPGLNSFVLYFALPAMLYRYSAQTPIAKLLDTALLSVYLLVAAIMITLTILVTKRGRIGWNDAALGALVATFPNVGFMGVPMLVAILGEVAAGPIIVILAADMVVTSSVCIALSRLDGDAETAALPASVRLRQALRKALHSVLGNPMAWSMVLGGVASATCFHLPQALDKTVALLGNAASPVALFTIGAVLARANMVSGQGRHAHAGWGSVWPVAVFKLVLHPLLAFGLGKVAQAAGLPLSDAVITVMTLAAALPSASNVSLLAERFGADTARIARIILLTTVAAFGSFALVAGWMTG
ncbi:AEC family transporter [Brachymonas denitrificans]|uniref:AEC family transporter n=1 Tax=Brachymonas denitrificans TaxID=28220 RepID=UPI002AFE1921|nr:AEC family transporter [Brachymonas denitrificans]